MIQLGTILKVVDKTGIFTAQCLKVLNFTQARIAYLGDVIIITVKTINVKRFAFLKARLQKLYRRGSIHRALIVRTKVKFCRIIGAFLCFKDNACVLITRKKTRAVVPLSNKVYGPILREFCTKWPSLGCVSHCII